MWDWLKEKQIGKFWERDIRCSQENNEDKHDKIYTLIFNLIPPFTWLLCSFTTVWIYL